MRRLPRISFAAMSGVAALAVVVPAAIAHGSGANHEMPGRGGTMGSDMMGLMGRCSRVRDKASIPAWAPTRR